MFFPSYMALNEVKISALFFSTCCALFYQQLQSWLMLWVLDSHYLPTVLSLLAYIAMETSLLLYRQSSVFCPRFLFFHVSPLLKSPSVSISSVLPVSKVQSKKKVFYMSDKYSVSHKYIRSVCRHKTIVIAFISSCKLVRVSYFNKTQHFIQRSSDH